MKRRATVLTGLALTLFAATLQASEFEVSFRDLTTLSSRPDNDDDDLDNPTTSSFLTGATCERITTAWGGPMSDP